MLVQWTKTLLRECLVLALGLTAVSLSVSGQQLPIRRYDTSDGLAHGIVKSIYQDAKGYIWFGTFEGLSRFDGYHFTNYDTRDGLGHPIINQVTEDRQGRLWFATNGGGVARLLDEPPNNTANRAGAQRTGDGKFVTFQVGDTSESNKVNRMLFDSQNNIWCLTDFGLYRARMTDRDLKFEAVVARSSLNSGALLEDQQGRVWCGVGDDQKSSCDLIEVNANRVINHGPVGASQNIISGFIEDRQGRLLVWGSYGLFEFIPPVDAGGRGESRRWPLKLKANQVTGKLFEDSNGTLWLGTNTGLIKYQNGLQTEYTTAQGLSSNRSSVLAEDRDGNLWIGTDGAGVIRLSGGMFISFTPTQGLPDAFVLGTIEDRERRIMAILPGPDYALAEIGSGKVTRRGRLDYPPVSSDSFLVQLETPTAWWWGSYPYVWTRVSKPVIRMRSGREINVNDFGPFNVLPVTFLFYEDETGRLWLTKETGKNPGDGRIYRADPARPGPLAFESFPSDFTWSGGTGMLMISDLAGGLWLGKQEMLGRLWHGRFIRLQPTEGLPETDPRCFFLDSRGWLWIGMRYNGVSMTKEPGAENPQFINYSTEQGLASNAVRSIVEDEFGRIYFGTDRGLNQFDPSTNLWRQYTRRDGLAGDKINHLYKDRLGNIWISTFFGISKLDPRAKQRGGGPAPIYFNHVSIAGDDLPLPETGATQIPKIELAAGRNSLSIEFVALSFQAEDSLRYQYRLEGVDTDWNSPTKSRLVNYARLAAGTYRFLVRAVNADGAISETPASFSFTILPPLWQRWWFIAIITAFAGAVAYSLYRYRVLRLVELERVRTRIAGDLHDDIGANLTKIAILSEVAHQQLGPDNNPADNTLSSIADISRESVASMRDIVWAINPKRDSLLDLTRRMRTFASDIFTSRDIEFLFSAPDRDREVKLSPEVRRDVFLIFKEAVNNIVRHSGCAKAAIDLSIENGYLVLSVSDDGKGVEARAADEGHGFSSMRRRAESFGGVIEIISDNGHGTTVRLRVPLARSLRALTPSHETRDRNSPSNTKYSGRWPT